MSDLKQYHPEYMELLPLWEKCEDFAEGETTVKKKGVKYLPATEGMILDGMGDQPNTTSPNIGQSRYNAYRMRAAFPDYVGSAVEVMTGLLHQKPPVIELPAEMEYMRDRASSKGERLGQLFRRLTMEQIVYGRLGLLPDMPSTPKPGPAQFTLSLYNAKSIINWDDGTDMGHEANLQMVVLDESGIRRTPGTFTWEHEESYRVLELIDGQYRQGVFSGVQSNYAASDMKAPMYMSRPSNYIPFVFVNSTNLLASTQMPPLKRLVDMCHAIYMGEADYRQQLHSQSQDTLVVIGGVRNTVNGNPDDPNEGAVRVGAGARIDLDINGDAKFIGVATNGISEARTAIENDRKRAQVKSGELIQNNGSQMESGAALSTRFNAQTATLNQLAKTAAAGLESALRHVAIWMGLDPKAVKVEPNLEFVDFALEGQNFHQLMQAKDLGFPLSYRTLHELAADRGLTTTDFNTEIDRITEEKALGDLLVKKEPVTPPANGGGGN